MAVRLRLFEEDAVTSDCDFPDVEKLLTPFGKGDNSFSAFNKDDSMTSSLSDTPLSIEIPTRKVLRQKTSVEVRRSLFAGKRRADWDDSSNSSTSKKNNFSTEDRPSDDVSPQNPCSTIPTDVIEKLESDDIIADGSRDYTFPTVPGKHGDLKSISTETMAEVVRGKYHNTFEEITIIDCRYPYEFEGGHVRGAVNLYTKDAINSLLQNSMTSNKRHVLIFHCEFSSERGPKMYRFLRSQDRLLHKDQYPKLRFPEVYLLAGGYKAFYNQHQDLCDPVSYKPMLHKDHAADLRYFRAKSKSWTNGDQQMTSRRHRSRLSRHLSF